MFYAFVIFIMHAIYYAHLVLGLIIIIIFGEEFEFFAVFSSILSLHMSWVQIFSEAICFQTI
jgi:hypothetical protein